MAFIEYAMIVIVVILSILISRRQLLKRRIFFLQSERAKQFLLPIPSNPTNPDFIPLVQRLRTLLTFAFIAESEKKFDKACEYYYYAIILDQELDKFYENKLKSCLEVAYAILLTKNDPLIQNIESDQKIKHIIQLAQESEEKHDIANALRLYIDANSFQCRMHRYLDALSTANKIDQLKRR